MYQIPSNSHASSGGGVNRATAAAVLLAVTLFSGLVFVIIAETVFPSPAMAQDPGARDRDLAIPSVVRPGEGAEVATTELVEPDPGAQADPIELAGDEAPDETSDGDLEPRRDPRPRGDRPEPAARPGANERTSHPERPANGAPDDIFGRDSDDPLGDLDFGPSIAG